MVLFTTINMCLCCCTNDTMYYGSLMATGLVILIGTAVMAFLGIGAEAPAVIQAACGNDPRAHADLGKIMDGIHIGFWIILAVNGTFGLWILLLAILKFCSANQDEQEKQQAFVPIQLSPEQAESTPLPEVTPNVAPRPAAGAAVAVGKPGGTRGL